ncbi:EsV-1-7 [Ectocarpus siliculosus]|uniref:EsV-1-7 n=1 Tax=Ectocarpus siliculosus TaxID=2880 RepID=D8LUB2_ECTSI|nr:EsV-1-7 [Ectocarpus siliculosus]|eukprot:CBN75453.1 EsV-1-7 [Ectocarpus siliculosus]
MIDVRSRRCAEPGCKRQPSYGFEGKRACYCAAHKLEGQVDVVSRRCEEPGCRRRPLYGYEGQKSQFCSAHKQEGQVDVCNRRCQHPGCSKRPCFGLPGQRPCFCGSHRSPEMVDVISHKCAYPGCSHPTGHEANRVRSKFCDKHKSVGLAGASLLQLAGGAESSASSPAPTGTGQNAANSPPPEGATAGGGPWISGNQMRGGGLPAGADEQQPPASVQQKHAPAAAEPRTRRASFNAPAVAPIIQPVLPDLKTQHTRRSSMPAPLLPSVQSLLDDIPHGGLKRQRDEGRARQQPYDTDADSATSSSSSPLPPPPGPPEDAAGFARPGPAHVAVSGSAAEKRGGREGRVDESGRDASSVAADGASAQARTPKKTTSLFSGPAAAAAAAGNAQQQDGERATRRKVWNPHQSPPSSTTGYVTSSPAMNWRRDGVATLGRAASFDEARLAERKSGMQSEDSSKPRRASAFVTHGSALPPRVIEMHRRDSAYETRTVPAGAGRVAHYSDLLSANASSRSVTAFNGRPGYSPSLTLAHPDAVIEEEAVAGAAAAGQREDGAGAGAPSGGGRPPMPGSRAAARMFHVMPATAVFAGDLPSYARGETPSKATTAAAAASSAAQAGGGGGRRRWSVLDPAGPAAKEGGGAAATLVAAWGAPVDEGTEDKDDAADAGTTSAVEDRGMGSRRAGSGVGNVGEYQAPNRHPRRGSMMTPAAPAGRPRTTALARSPPPPRQTTRARRRPRRRRPRRARSSPLGVPRPTTGRGRNQGGDQPRAVLPGGEMAGARGVYSAAGTGARSGVRAETRAGRFRRCHSALVCRGLRGCRRREGRRRRLQDAAR